MQRRKIHEDFPEPVRDKPVYRLCTVSTQLSDVTDEDEWPLVAVSGPSFHVISSSLNVRLREKRTLGWLAGERLLTTHSGFLKLAGLSFI